MTPEEVAAFCRALPGACESIKWGNNRVFSIAGNKMFAIVDLIDKGKSKLAFKVDDDLFLGFTDRPGIRPAPYLARARWVAMEAPYPMSGEELRAALARSHQLVALRLPKYRQGEFLIVAE
ncbi:MmcQ/YjbR family DNA-binding protein [Zoogloea sp. G-4-1-14]|uniref:MmcQ/YjbR family DNA-binding protein n=2 Tax=Zoogloea dura TaxID=2728840 RepID=A0A848G686_9RHOO|nr:MmcQ/YjbR family DNA-binding protein [Zoogloea dura]